MKRKNNKKWYLLFILPVCVILLIPFAGMTFWATNETTENTVLAEFPSIMEEGKLNQNYLPELGTYFEDHFAFRQAMVTANAVIRGTLFQESTTNQVVEGTGRWLYYGGTLNDYRGRNLMNQRELFMVTHNLKLMQQYAQGMGSHFLFTIAPNKNSLYDGHMPYYYEKGQESNVDNLTPLMIQDGLSYLNLFDLFRSHDEVLYFHRDSHWNNKGAVAAYNAMMDIFGKEHETYLNVPYHLEKIHTGDLDEMLYPLAYTKEDEVVYDKEWDYRYVNDVTDNMDDWIETENPEKQGTLLMYRDSFGESFLPFAADEMGKAYFSRLVPYNLTQIEQYHPDYIVIEKVERNLDDLIESAPIMEPLQTDVISAPETESSSKITAEKQGSYLMLRGTVEKGYIKDDTDIFVQIRNQETLEIKTYPVFYITTENGGDNGYQVYLKGGSLAAGSYHVSLIAENEGRASIVASKDITWNGSTK